MEIKVYLFHSYPKLNRKHPHRLATKTPSSTSPTGEISLRFWARFGHDRRSFVKNKTSKPVEKKNNILMV